jgi:hypothetical protein
MGVGSRARGSRPGDLQEHFLQRGLIEGGAAEHAARHLERRAVGDDAAAVKEDDAVAHPFDLGHVVRRVEDREAAGAPDVLERAPRLLRDVGIETRRRLVEDEEVGLVEERAREPGARLLAE